MNAAALAAVQTRFTALLHHLDVEALERAFWRQKRRASAGVDGITVDDYERNLGNNLQDLCARVHTGRYRPNPVRRVYIPISRWWATPAWRADAGRQDRPRARVAEVLSAIYEVDFLRFLLRLQAGAEPPPGRCRHCIRRS